MKLKISKLKIWMGAIAFSALAPLAHAGFVADGTFESGSHLNGWTSSPNSSTSTCLGVQPNGPFGGGHSSNFSAHFGCEGGSVTLSATLGISPFGYNVDYWVLLSNIGVGSSFSANLDTVGPGIPDGTIWTHFTGTWLAANSGNLTFTLTAGSAGSDVFLDDVRVVAKTSTVPEPGTLALVGLALAGVGVLRRRKG